MAQEDGPGRDARELEGCLVEIHGMDHDVEPEAFQRQADPDSRPVGVNGAHGRAVVWMQESDKYLVHVFDGFWVAIPEANLRAWTPPEPEAGGFDVAWPSVPEAFISFAMAVNSTLMQKGWCLIEMIVSDKRRREAADQAAKLPNFTCPKEELVHDLLGRGSAGGKIAAFRPGGGTDAKEGAEEDESVACDALTRCSLELSNLFVLLRPMTYETLGFECYSRSEEMAWIPCASKAEEASLGQGCLTEEDVQAGKVDEHLVFLQRRKLCMMYMIANNGGEVYLHPRDSGTVRIPVSKSKLLVFRHDCMSFSYEPKGQFLVLQAWTLEAPQQLQLTEIQGDPVHRNRIRGLERGPKEPLGDRAQILSLMSRFPGNGYGVAKYGTAFSQGLDAQVRIPTQRFDANFYCVPDGVKDHMEGKSDTLHGGFCSEKDIFFFDNTLFGIEPEEVVHMAPAQRVVLETGFQCLEAAGYSREKLEGSQCGTFIGDCGSDWFPHLMADKGMFATPFAQDGCRNYSTASRLAHVLGLTGPVASVDTACSSSLVAAGVAMSRLRPPGEEDVLSANIREAVVMGICTIISPWFYVLLSAPHMLSKKGRCFTFDDNADGYERGEGCGAIFVRLSGLEPDIAGRVACLMGSATNQDGRSATLTAPNGPSQQSCIKESLREAGAGINDVTIAECHGTGTALGDPIEVGALHRVMEDRVAPLCCTSAKSNIGHLEACAGMAGLIKCVAMLLSSSAPPNCHLNRVNAHLGSAGFPAIFETEAMDTGLNSGITGVSSFGFGGTNGRCDVWGESRTGPRATGRVDVGKLDQISVTCPITMGPIDHLTGEPAVSSGGPRGVRKHRASVLRDEFAPYDVSSHVYSGGYRFRSQALYPDGDDHLDPATKVFICSSATGWQTMEQMELQKDGWYSAALVLSECRYDRFHLRLDRDKMQEIYPAVDNASDIIWVCGPDGGREGRNWIIDGRDAEVPAGTPFRVRFKWGRDRKALVWERAGAEVAKAVKPFRHAYSVVGSWTAWQPQDMTPSPHESGMYECKMRVGQTGQEEFQFVRDHDFKQVIYPARPQAVKRTIPVRGPDELGKGKHWLVRAPRGDVVDLQLRIVDAKVSVAAISVTKGTKVWESNEGWARHEYFVIGSFTGWQCAPMGMDPRRPGTFRCYGAVGDEVDPELGCFTAEFRVVVDEDIAHSYHPEVGHAGSGECIVRGPPSDGEGRNWLARTVYPPSRPFEITLDLTAEDRRRIVTWRWVQPMEHDGPMAM